LQDIRRKDDDNDQKCKPQRELLDRGDKKIIIKRGVFRYEEKTF